jgi:hypothetical protein
MALLHPMITVNQILKKNMKICSNMDGRLKKQLKEQKEQLIVFPNLFRVFDQQLKQVTPFGESSKYRAQIPIFVLHKYLFKGMPMPEHRS